MYTQTRVSVYVAMLLLWPLFLIFASQESDSWIGHLASEDAYSYATPSPAYPAINILYICWSSSEYLHNTDNIKESNNNAVQPLKNVVSSSGNEHLHGREPIKNTQIDDMDQSSRHVEYDSSYKKNQSRFDRHRWKT